MITWTTAAIVQSGLLVYHQLTTWFDFFPFNGVRNYRSKERSIEAGINVILMGLPIVGFAFGIQRLMWFGVIYFPVLFLMEITIWWLPYFYEPRGAARRAYNWALAIATSNFSSSDALEDWVVTYRRIHTGTITFLPTSGRRIVPNLEHTLLHAWTFVTAIVTFLAFHQA